MQGSDSQAAGRLAAAVQPDAWAEAAELLTRSSGAEAAQSHMVQPCGASHTCVALMLMVLPAACVLPLHPQCLVHEQA